MLRTIGGKFEFDQARFIHVPIGGEFEFDHAKFFHFAYRSQIWVQN